MVHSQSQSETRGGAFASERSRWWVDVFEGGFIRVMNRQCVLRVFRRFGRLAAARFDSTTTRLDDDSAPDDARLADATADATTDRSVFSRSFSSSRPGASDVVERRASGVVFGRRRFFAGKGGRQGRKEGTMRRRRTRRTGRETPSVMDDDDDGGFGGGVSLEDAVVEGGSAGDDDAGRAEAARRSTPRTRARTRAGEERRRRRLGEKEEDEEGGVMMMDAGDDDDDDAMDADDGDDGVDRLSALPRDVAVEIVRRLESERDVAAAAMTCTAFRSATRCEGVWRNLLASKLGAEAAVVLPKRLSDEVAHPSSLRRAARGGLGGAFDDGEETMGECQRRDASSAVWETPKWMLKYQRWHNPTKGTLTWSASTTEESLEPAETKYAARYLHRCTAVGDKSKILFFGGQGHGSDFYNDLHVLDLDAKELRLKQLYAKSSQEPPFPRCSGTLTSMAVTGMPNSEVVALFGGSQGFFEGFSNSLLILCADDGVLRVSDAATDGGGLTWREPIIRANPLNPEGRIPAARWGHSAVALNGKLILFGGSNTTHCFNDTWLLELVLEEGRLVAVWTLLLDGERSAGPPPRAGQTACLVKSCLYIFGGCHVSEVFNDVWKLDLTAPGGFLRWEEFKCRGTPPAPRVGHAAVVLGDRIILSGGRGSATRGAIGKYATDKDSLASMQGLTFFQSGFAMLDTSSRKWLPIQHAVMEDTDGDTNSCDRVTHVREHRTGHAMMPARNGCLLLIGGLGYDGVFQNDLSLVSMF